MKSATCLKVLVLRLIAAKGGAAAAVLLGLSALSLASVAEAQLPRFGPVESLASGAANSGNEVAPALVSDGGGNWLAVWSATDSLDRRYGRDSDLYFSLSHDNGRAWTPARVLNSNAGHDLGGDTEVVAAAGRDGVWVAIWSSDDHPPEIVGTDRDLYFVRSPDGGRSWSKPSRINAAGADDWGDDDQPALATDGDGNWVVVWSSSDTLGARIGGDRDILYSISRDDAVSWSKPQPVDSAASRDDFSDSSPTIDCDKEGHWVVAWSGGGSAADGVHQNRAILASRLEGVDSPWSDPELVSQAEEGSGRQHRGPKLAAGDGGAWVAVWESADTLGGRIGLDRDILVSRSADEGRTWTIPAALNVNAARDAGDDASPAIAYDGNGLWLVAWSTWERMAYALGADADLFVALSEDDGANWTPPMTLNRTARSDYGEDLAIAVTSDRRGAWVAAWQSNEPIDGQVRTDFDLFTARAQFRLQP